MPAGRRRASRAAARRRAVAARLYGCAARLRERDLPAGRRARARHRRAARRRARRAGRRGLRRRPRPAGRPPASRTVVARPATGRSRAGAVGASAPDPVPAVLQAADHEHDVARPEGGGLEPLRARDTHDGWASVGLPEASHDGQQDVRVGRRRLPVDRRGLAPPAERSPRDRRGWRRAASGTAAACWAPTARRRRVDLDGRAAVGACRGGASSLSVTVARVVPAWVSSTVVSWGSSAVGRRTEHVVGVPPSPHPPLPNVSPCLTLAVRTSPVPPSMLSRPDRTSTTPAATEAGSRRGVVGVDDAEAGARVLDDLPPLVKRLSPRAGWGTPW